MICWMSFIHKSMDNSVCSSIKSSRLVSYTYDFIAQPWFQKIKSSGNNITVIPTYKPEYILTNNSYVITYAANIFDITSAAPLEEYGTLLLNFNVSNFRNAFDTDEVLKGFVLVLTKDGKVVYNSAGDYTGDTLPYFNELMVLEDSITLDKEYVFTMNKDCTQDFIIASIIPKNEITREVNSIQRMILVLTISIIALVILITIIWTGKLTTRIKRITSSMRKVESGIFDCLIEVHGSDEIDHIARSFNNMCIKLHDHINEIYISRINQNKAELKALQAQINPHFLYNTLESLRMKAVINNDTDVADMIYMLSNLFRWSIKTTKTIITISEELSYVKYYLDLQKMRLGSRLDYSIEIPEDVLHCEIIKFTLQPLIENSIQHGIEHLMEGGKIVLAAKRVQDEIVFEIMDNGPGMEQSFIEQLNRNLNIESSLDDESIGLRSVNDRIKLTYGSMYGIEVKKREDGTSVIVRIPVKEREED